jgi:hypothetical protein
MYYTLQDFREITNAGFSYKLPEETIIAIQELCHDMNTSFHPAKLRDFSHAPTAAAAPQWGRDVCGTIAATAAAVAAFKPTAKPEVSQIEKKMNDIRICLNKISPKNVDAQYSALLEHIAGAREAAAASGGSSATIVKVIFDICSLNKFYTEIYASVYSKLMWGDGTHTGDTSEIAAMFRGLLLETFETKYLPSFETIRYVEPATDYDGFCNYNKENDNRKAHSCFFIQLAKLGAMEHGRILGCLEHLLDLISAFICEENRTNEVEEITENIYIFVSKCGGEFGGNSATQQWSEIMDKIQNFAQMKHTAYPSITNRAIFKFMDIMD